MTPYSLVVRYWRLGGIILNPFYCWLKITRRRIAEGRTYYPPQIIYPQTRWSQLYDCDGCASARFPGEWRVATIHPLNIRAVQSLSDCNSQCWCFQSVCSSRTVCCFFQYQADILHVARSPLHSPTRALPQTVSSRVLWPVVLLL